jgi:plasmid maintenance system antidote protein VapI
MKRGGLLGGLPFRLEFLSRLPGRKGIAKGRPLMKRARRSLQAIIGNRLRNVRLEKVFGGSAESWLVQQAQYDLAQVRPDRIKLKRLEPA